MPHGEQQIAVPASDPESIAAWIARFLEWIKVRAYSDHTIAGNKFTLRLFEEWCATRSITRPQDVNRAVLDAYQRHIFYLRKEDGEPLHASTQRGRLCSVKMFFRYLSRQGVLPFNPASDIDMPRQERALPKHVLTAVEADAVVDQANSSKPLGIRDRAIMEILYSTGMRRSELVRLDIFDVDFGSSVARIRKSKTKVQRVVPIGERALLWLQKYLDEVRPVLAGSWEVDQSLFLSYLGRRMNANGLSVIISRYVKASGTEKLGSCHMFRHTAATLMVENNAGIRYVQELLGHSDLNSTVIYTRVSIAELRRVHALTHPSAKMERMSDKP